MRHVVLASQLARIKLRPANMRDPSRRGVCLGCHRNVRCGSCVGMHHVCIEVPDVTAAIAELKAKGIRVLSDEPKIGAHNKPVVFLHPKDCGGVLTELEEE